MILHCVFCNFQEHTSKAEQIAAIEALRDFSLGLDGVLAFDHGPNLDFEKKSQAYGAGFIIRFKDAEALTAYAIHPTHQELGGQLSRLCEGGGDGIIVYDLDV